MVEVSVSKVVVKKSPSISKSLNTSVESIVSPSLMKNTSSLGTGQSFIGLIHRVTKTVSLLKSPSVT